MYPHASQVNVPGEPLSSKTVVFDANASMVQNFDPIHGFIREIIMPSFVSGDLSRQLLTHHFQFPLTEDFIQCAIYDSNSANSKLLGVGYAVSEKIFSTLPAEEKILWQSLAWLAKSGMFLIPLSTLDSEHEDMENFAHFYAKVYHFWKLDLGDSLPLGPPELMMTYTSDGQIKPEIMHERNTLSKTSLSKSREDKADIQTPLFDDMADYWETGTAMQLKPFVKDSVTVPDFSMIPVQQIEGQLMKKLADKPVPGAEITLKESLLNTFSSALQSFYPLKNICNHFYGVHIYSGDMTRQNHAHHYCSHLNEDIRQCLVFDSASKHARLIGVEYVISEKLFKTLPEEEKIYWHSHIWEVKSGMAICPQLPEAVDHEAMKDIIHTYGKAIQTWHVDQDALPLGIPQIVITPQTDSQVHPDLFKLRDQVVWKTSYMQATEQRKGIIPPVRDPMADQWLQNRAIQIKVEEIHQKGL